MWKALEHDGLDVELIGPLAEPFSRLWTAKARLYRKVLGSTYERERQPWLLRQYGRQVRASLVSGCYDVVMSPGTIPISYLETVTPVVFWTDATFGGMTDFYGSFTNLAAETLRDGNAAERAALERCSLAIYSSDWAAATAARHYSVDSSRLRVVPFGANLPYEPAAADVTFAVDRRPMDECRLLFVGMEWGRKGGDTAVEVAGELVRRGVRATLTVIGTAPPPDSPPFVRYEGFLDKRRPGDLDRYAALLMEAHFLIVPSRAEAFGIVFAEASAFGVPSLAVRVGGVPTVVRDGINGHLFEPGSSPAAYADCIQGLLSRPAVYRSLASSARSEYQARLNWASAASRVHSMLLELVPQG
jgi:glycosyltransferase involved in cell wall biosynthesis